MKKLMERIIESPSSFHQTKSLHLELGKSPSKSYPAFSGIPFSINHQELTPLQEKSERLFGPSSEILKDEFLLSILNLRDKSAWTFLTLFASMYSLVIDAMPNLETLESTYEICFQLEKLEKRGGTSFSRPLLGLSNLKILQLGKKNEREISVRDGVCLMIFLENLTHLQVSLDYSYQDEKFLRDHKEVIVGKSKVTHLDLACQLVRGKKKNWPAAYLSKEVMFIATDLADLLLPVLAKVNEFKFDWVGTPNLMIVGISLSILKHLKSSSHSLKFLSLVGMFSTHPIDPKAKGLAIEDHINLVNLETISLNYSSIVGFRQFGLTHQTAKLGLSFPSLKNIHFFSHHRQGLVERFPEEDLMEWMKKESFPTSVEQILCSKRPLNEQGSLVDLKGKEMEWRKARRELRDLCNQKGLTLTLLEDEEQIMFQTIPSMNEMS